MKIINKIQPVMLIVRPRNFAFISLTRVTVTCIAVIAGKLYKLKLTPEELAKYPVTAYAIIKKPFGWVVVEEELR